MQKRLLIVLLLVSTFKIHAQNISFFSNLGSSLDDRATNIYVGPNSFVYLLGQTYDTLFVPNNSGGSIAIPPVSFNNYFLTCMDNSGNHQWTKMFGYNTNNSAYARFTVNAAGETIFLIAADDYIKIDTDSISCGGILTNVLCKLDAGGNVVAHQSVFNIIPDGTVDQLKTDVQSNIYVTGTFRSQLELLVNGIHDTTITPGSPDKYAFIIKYDNSFNRTYAKHFGNIINDFDFSGNANCNVLVEINNGDSLKIDTALYVPVNTARQQYLVKLDSAGKNILCTQLGGIKASNYKLLNMQHIQNSFEISGTLIDTAFIGSQIIVSTIPIGMQGSYEELFSAQVDETTFSVTAAQSFQSYSELGNGGFLKTTSTGNVKYLLYNYADSTGFDTVYHQVIKNENIVVKAFDNNYTKLWTKGFGSFLDDYAQGIALDGSNNAYILGLFRDTLQVFDSLSIAYKTNSSHITSTSIISKGGADIFVGKISSTSVITSVSQNNLQTLHIFPNPANDQIKISNVDGVYSLYDMQGHCLKNGNLNTANETMLSVKDLASGIYFIRVLNKTGSVQYVKVIKE